MPASTQQPPIYPGAEHLTLDYTSTVNVKYATFEVAAKPNAVQSFYRDFLLRDNWTVDPIAIPETPYSLYFSWRDRSGSSGGYSLDLDIESVKDGKLLVKLKLVGYAPM